MTPTESSSLLHPDVGANGPVVDAAASSGSTVSTILLSVQAALVAFFIFGTTYPEEDYSVKEYIAFRDIMAMLLIGFGCVLAVERPTYVGCTDFNALVHRSNRLCTLLSRGPYEDT